MKRVFALILMLLPYVASAQEQSLEFYYIAHDRTTPVNDLCDRLEFIHETAMSFEDRATIFYMPAYKEVGFDEEGYPVFEPLVVKVNLPGDNRDDFKKIISELRVKMAHESYIDVDIKTITDLFNQEAYDFINEDGEPKFSSVTFCWYVTPEFWLFKYNETLIANLYFTLDMNPYHKSGYMTTEIWHAKGDGIEKYVDRSKPFGSKNLCRDMLFILRQY